MDNFAYEYPNYSVLSAFPTVPLTSGATPLPSNLATSLTQPQDDGAGPVRRQNRSCDQCRKGKRRCDAVVLRDYTVNGEDGNIDNSQNLGGNENGAIQTPGPCTYCVKTKKTCTFEWLKSHEPVAKAKKDHAPADSSRTYKKTKTEASEPVIQHTTQLHNTSTSLSPPDSQSTGGSSKDTPSVVSSDTQWPMDYLVDLPPQDLNLMYGMPDTIPQDYTMPTQQFDQFAYSSIPPSIGSANFDQTFLPDPGPTTILDGWQQPMPNDIGLLQTRNKRPLLLQENGEDEDEQHQQIPEFSSVEFLFDTSPYSISERLTYGTNQNLMSTSLMKIYHDSMENALSCWLNERTCPYRYKQKRLTNGSVDATEKSLEQAWAQDWPNRIFRRVFALDRMAGKIRDKPLSRQEENAASKALYMVIMSFATQWSQASYRSREEHPTAFGAAQASQASSNFGETPVTPPSDSEFDRRLQEQYWREARKALLECADIESFKVAFAHIVFSLVQKPMSVEQQEKVRRGSNSTVGLEKTDDFGELEERVQRVIDEDGPPIYLEQGVRHAHSLRHKLQRRERELAKGSKHIDPKRTVLNEEDRTTVELLAWLGYMLESLTSAMHQRPLVVSDEDCDVLPESIQALNLSDDETMPKKPSTSRLWTDYFFLQERSNRRGEQLRYPCSYDQAARGLTDAAPIKVLLYRKVTLLQTHFSRGSQASKIEEAITDSMNIYYHWKGMYEPFVKDCIENHDSLPPRIQTWYICVTAHWHLATLLLADVIESLDVSELSSPVHRDLRRDQNLVAALRRHNAHMVSDLARCATPRREGSFQHSPQFHFALNAGALLTEPWTAILIRVFSKAAVLLMQEACTTASAQQASSPSQIIDIWQAEQIARRCEDCVRALKYLGKKSDTARLAGDTLAEALYNKSALWTEADLGMAVKGEATWLANGEGLDDLPLYVDGEVSGVSIPGFS